MEMGDDLPLSGIWSCWDRFHHPRIRCRAKRGGQGWELGSPALTGGRGRGAPWRRQGRNVQREENSQETSVIEAKGFEKFQGGWGRASSVAAGEAAGWISQSPAYAARVSAWIGKLGLYEQRPSQKGKREMPLAEHLPRTRHFTVLSYLSIHPFLEAGSGDSILALLLIRKLSLREVMPWSSHTELELELCFAWL